LAFKEQQARELAKATTDLMDQTYIHNLTLTQNNELLAYLNGTLSSALRNAPSGFYGSAFYAGPYTTPRGPTDVGPAVPYTGSGTTYGGGKGVPQTIILQVDGKILTTVVVGKLDQFAAATGGDGSSRSDALNRMPLS
jgi:hypothetical protein